MKSQPLVSIVMNCLNCSEFLRTSIDSIYEQTYNNWEIIFWDNSSCDNSIEIAKSYDSKIKYYKTDKTVPLYEARNYAIEKCNGELIAFLDCDDVWINTKLDKQVQIFSKLTPLVYSKFKFIDENSQEISTKLPKSSLNKISTQLLINNPISISGVLIDSQLLKKEKFNKVYNLLGDFELWFRLSLSHDFAFVDEVLELSRQHPNTTSLKNKKKWIREQRIFYKDFIKSRQARKKVGIIEIIRYIVKCELLGLISLVR